ncbi:MAG: SDR family oxidoreductase [Comamonadaceae bacterium]|nr:MAG: SDR family oxidoreductase [Comamonadaceae bacterium]
MTQRDDDSIRLDGQVAVVTGSGRGLGLAFAKALARAGARVVVNDVDPDTAQQAVEAIRADGGEAVAEVVAVGPTAAAEALVRRAVDTWGRLDVLCANAGILRDRVLWNMTDDDFDAVIDTHLRGTFTCARAAVRQMRAQGDGGALVLLASPAGQQGNFGQGNYSAAKAGITGFTRTWAMECARSKISVNAIVPVAFTQMVATIPGLAQYADQVARGEGLPAEVRQGGLGLPEDVAPLLVFLASQQARHITGQCIGIGGDKLSLWSHPGEIRAAYSDGGWSADQIARVWRTSIGANLPRPAPLPK